jgi:flagellar motor switch protein FliM
MAEILSQEEIDALLTAISTGGVDTSEYIPEKKKARIYDFRRPDKFTKDHIMTLQMMHESFARLSTTMLSAKLRSLAGIHVISVDQLTFEEFIRSIPNPALIAAVNIKPLPGSIIIEIDPSISFTIIDMLAGGEGYAAKISREHTDIELMLMEEICNGLIDNLRLSWSCVIELSPELANLETNPQFAQIVPPDDMVVLITLQAKIGCVEGMINIAIPYITIEPVIERLSAQYRPDHDIKKTGTVVPEKFSVAVYKRYISYTGALPGMTLDDLRKMKPGTRINLQPASGAKAFYEYAKKREEVNNG